MAIVVIDENALLKYGQWPWPRTRMAELAVENLLAGLAGKALPHRAV